MLKYITCATLIFAMHGALGHPQDSTKGPVAQIVSFNQTLDGPSGQFAYQFETSDGIKQEATGSLKDVSVPEVDPSTGKSAGVPQGQG